MAPDINIFVFRRDQRPPQLGDTFRFDYDQVFPDGRSLSKDTTYIVTEVSTTENPEVWIISLKKKQTK